MRNALASIAVGTIAACGSASVHAKDAVRFNRDVLPILAENCYACHGADKTAREADLRLDQRESAVRDREGTRAIVPGQPEQSELWKRISSSDPQDIMPPPQSSRRLNEAQRELIRRWISEGAPYERHWAYIPPQRVEPPELPRIVSAIDRFVRFRLLQEGLEPSPPADRATLIRRATLDLIGLPPTPLEVDAYVNDSRSDAFERVVQRLLASEHFGERWARWWLDLAHYADSDGYLQDFVRPTAWRYRQWVVDALNRDLPFDRFTTEQLAGDLLPGQPQNGSATNQQRVATGFLRNTLSNREGGADALNRDLPFDRFTTEQLAGDLLPGQPQNGSATNQQRVATGFLRNTLSNREGGADLEEYRVRQAVDRAVTVGTVWLAMTIGCAECHDHKFDAITQREFYQLFAFFNNVDEVNIDAPSPEEAEAYRTAKAVYDRKRAELLAPVDATLAELLADWERRLMDAEANANADFAWQRALEVLGLTWGQGQGEGQLEGINIIKTPLAQRTPEQRERLLDYFLANAPALYSPKFEEFKVRDLRTKLDALQAELPAITRAPTITQTNQRRPTHIHIRGDFRRLGEEVSPGTPAVLPPMSPGHEANRLAFAEWLVSPNHPLTARVTVNRLWQELFGRGLVATSENFGVRGGLPSHPELLDWLAVNFEQNGWSIKETLRQIVLSETYRQSSQSRSDLTERDPGNRLLARQNRLRLSAESIRDVTLASSGLLNRTVGGPSVKPPQPDSVTQEGFANKWETSKGADRYRRGLYTFIQRTSPFAQFVTFDFPDSTRTCTRRERTTTPLQALNLLNDPVFFEAAQALAKRIWNEVRNDDAERLKHAYLLTLSRPPQPEEARRLLAYLREQQALFESEETSAGHLFQNTGFDEITAERAAWVALASVLLNLDEFVTRE